MEYLPEFTLHRPTTIEDALAHADEGGRYLAGGTDLLVNTRRGIERPGAMVDLALVGELGGIEDTDKGGLRLGAGVRLEDIAGDARLGARYPAVAEAAAAVAGPTHRRAGTLGGNLCLDTRCLYYNQSEWWRSSNDFCLKHQGTVCHVAPKGSRCFAAYSGDVAPALLVSGAEVEIAGAEGRRRAPLGELWRDDGLDHLTLASGDLVVAVHLPAPIADLASGYEKARVRGSIDFPLAGVALSLALDDGVIHHLALALTGVNPSPRLVTGTEALIGNRLDDEAILALRDLARTQARPMRTTTIKPWYRRRVVGALTTRLARRLGA